MTCPICSNPNLRSEYSAPELQVFYCPSCRHRKANFADLNLEKSDYYEVTPVDELFTKALARTRRRQAALIEKKAKEIIGSLEGWIDYGCGRCVFLEHLYLQNWNLLAGYDSSASSRQWLKERNLPALSSKSDSPFKADWGSTPFPPKILSFLDVIEHFPEEQVFSLTQEALESLPSLEWLVVKVPISSGLLFRLAKSLRKITPAPFLQLFQVGSYPAHFHYFSERSLRLWAGRLNLTSMAKIDDPDYDDFFDRISFLRGVPGEFLCKPVLRKMPKDTQIHFFKIQK